MQWEKASQAKLIRVMLGSILLLLACIVGWFYARGTFVHIAILLLGLACLMGLRNAYMLDEADGPLVSVGPNGIVVSPALSAGMLIPWDDIKGVDCYSQRLYHVIPISSYVTIRVRRRKYLSSFPILGRGSWLGAGITIPSQFFLEGVAGARRMAAFCKVTREQVRHGQVGGIVGDMSVAGLSPQAMAEPPANAVGEGRPNLDDPGSRYPASRTGDAAAPEVRSPTAPYVPPGSPNYVGRAAASEPLLNGKPFPKEDRPVFGRRGL